MCYKSGKGLFSMMNNIINISKKVIAFAVSIIISLSFVCVDNTNASSDDYADLYQQMVDAVNVFRTSFGLEPLQLDMTLCDMAEVRAKEISVSFSHTRPDGSSSSTIFNDFNVKKGYSGENIAYYYKKSVLAVMEAWIDSKAHCANMLNVDYDYIGIGLYEDNGYYYWAQVYSSDVQELNLSLEEDENNSFMLGDVNLDGKIDATDSSMTMSVYSQLSAGNTADITELQMKSADVNGDGNVNATDASCILKYYSMLSMGMIPEF